MDEARAYDVIKFGKNHTIPEENIIPLPKQYLVKDVMREAHVTNKQVYYALISGGFPFSKAGKIRFTESVYKNLISYFEKNK